MTARRGPGRPAQAPEQLDLLGPPVEGWWAEERVTATGTSRVLVVADDREEARGKVERLLRDLGAVPGGPPGLHESFMRMCDFARGGRH